MKTPPCANWDVWLGNEIEGHRSIGHPTVFVRRYTNQYYCLEAIKRWLPAVNRIWFCKEFTEVYDMVCALELFKEVCIEVTLETLPLLPPVVAERAHIYLKVPAVLKPGDHVCVGYAFDDESFQIGTGNKVVAEQYTADVLL